MIVGGDHARLLTADGADHVVLDTVVQVGKG